MVVQGFELGYHTSKSNIQPLNHTEIPHNQIFPMTLKKEKYEIRITEYIEYSLAVQPPGDADLHIALHHETEVLISTYSSWTHTVQVNMQVLAYV